MDTAINFLYLNEPDMLKAGVLDAAKCVNTVSDVMVLLHKGDYMMGGVNKNEHGIAMTFPKESEFEGFPLDVGRDRRFMAMPAYLGGRFHIAGEKWYGSNSFNKEKGWPRSILTVMLNDIDSGAPIALMSANLLSAMRTGAMPGLAARLLAKKDSKTLGILGPGVINKTSAMAILSEFDIKTVKVKGSSPSSKSASDFVEFVKKEFPSVENVYAVDTIEDCLEGSDIVSEAVSVDKGAHPKIDGSLLEKGSVFISSGSVEFPDEFIASSVTNVVDNIKMYEMYVETWQKYDDNGERIPTGCAGLHMVNARDDGKMPAEAIHELGAIISGSQPARVSDDEIFFVGVGGMPILDVAWGYDVYQNAVEKGLGVMLNLWDEPYLH